MNTPRCLARRLLIAFYFAACWYGVSGKTCYGPDGHELSNVVDCDPSANVSACCAPGDYCYSNGLCAPSSYPANVTYWTKYFYNGCTDQTYQDAICLSKCKTSGGIGLETCSGAGPNAYCCFGQDSCNCNDPSEVFTLAAGTIVTLLPKTASANSASTVAPSNAVATPASTSTSAASTPTDGSLITKHERSNALPIGLGIGIGALVAIVGVFAGLWIKRRAVNQRNRGGFASSQQPFLAGYDGKAEVEGRPMFRVSGVPLIHSNPVEMEDKSHPVIQHELPA